MPPNCAMPADSTIRVGIAGAGLMGSVHAQIFDAEPRVKVVAVADPHVLAAEKLAQACGAASFRDAAEMIDVCRPELVVVATPPSQHEDVAQTALQTDVSVLVEKPLCLDGAVAERLHQNAKGAARLFYGENLLFAPAWSAAYRLCDQLLPRIDHVRAVFRTTGPHAPWLANGEEGGVLFDLASHAVATALWPLAHKGPGTLVDVTAHSGPFDLNPAAEQEARLHLLLPDGARATCEVSWLNDEAETCTLEIHGDGTRVECSMSGEPLKAWRGNHRLSNREISWSASALAGADWIASGGYREQARAVLADLRGGTRFPVEPVFAIQVIGLLAAARRTLATGGPSQNGRGALSSYPDGATHDAANGRRS